MKKILCLTLITILLLALSHTPTIAESFEITVILNDEVLEFDVPPQIINDRTMVPFRAIFEALGAEVYWDEWYDDTLRITAVRGRVTINLLIGDVRMAISRRSPLMLTSALLPQVTLDVPPMIVDNRTLVPIRAIAEGLNAKVDWNGDTQTITITTTDMPDFSEEEKIAQIEFSLRRRFEEREFPQFIFSDQPSSIEDFWEEAALRTMNYIRNVVIAENHYDREQILAFIDDNQDELIRSERHIVDIALEQIDEETSAIIIEIYDIGLTDISLFIGIAYSETAGLNYFNLRRTFDFHGDDEFMYMFWNVVPTAFGTSGSGRNSWRTDRDGFIESISHEMTRISAENIRVGNMTYQEFAEDIAISRMQGRTFAFHSIENTIYDEENGNFIIYLRQVEMDIIRRIIINVENRRVRIINYYNYFVPLDAAY